MRWRLIIEEFGPKLTYIKGANKVVADTLSRMKMTEKDFGPEVFAGETVKQKFPLSYKLLAEMQEKDKKLQKRLQSKDQTTYVYKTFQHSDKEYQTRDSRRQDCHSQVSGKKGYQMVPRTPTPSWRHAFRINAQAAFHLRWAEANVRESVQSMQRMPHAEG
jgi:hypothetical protein